MKTSQVFIVFIISLFAGFAAKFYDLNKYKNKVFESSAIICDVIQVRAQGGSTRDVHDQVFSFLRKYSPDPLANVVIKNGTKEVGSQISGGPTDFIETKCEIENSPDYEIKMHFHNISLLGLNLIEWVSLFFLVGLILFLILKSILKFTTTLWSNEIIFTLREDFGLATEIKPVSFLTKKIVQWMSNRLSLIKNEIHQLKNEVDQKNKSLQKTTDLVIEQNQILEKSKLFEDKVKMVKHDLKSPLSSMKFAVFNKDRESEVLPQIISTIEKILADLENQADLNLNEVEKNLSQQILEVIAKQAIEQKLIELSNHSKIKINLEYNHAGLSVVKIRPDYLNRIFSNLLQNAIEAIGNNDGAINIKISQSVNLATIEIKDSGNGIAPEIIDRLFSKGASFGKASGSGLGLHFVKTILNSWGGDIVVGSTSPLGTTFKLTLPLIEDLRGVFAGPDLVRSAGQLILVDDEAKKMNLLWGLNKTICLTSAQQFMNWWETEGQTSKLPLVIDYHLGQHINGLDILREIGSRPYTYLSTSDFMSLELIETVKEFKVQIIPKLLI